jgi:hypothetical protein
MKIERIIQGNQQAESPAGRQQPNVMRQALLQHPAIRPSALANVPH